LTARIARALALGLALAACQDEGPSTVCDPVDRDEMCARYPEVPTPFVAIEGIPTSEGFAFDASGFLVNVDCATGALWRTPSGGEPELLLPSIEPDMRGIVILEDGTIVLVSPANELLLVRTDLTVEVLLGNLPEPNDVAVGPDKMLYVTHIGGELRRVDPETGESELLYSDPTRRFDGITFGPGHQALYFDTETDAEIYRMSRDGTGDLGPAELFATIPGEVLLDGMTADACGNLYVADMNSGVWLVDPEGKATRIAGAAQNGSALNTPNSLHFGSGIGGWGADQLYVMTFGSDFYQLEVCVLGEDEP